MLTNLIRKILRPLLASQLALRLVVAYRLLPGALFNPNLPKKEALARAKKNVTLEIVSHCWNYSHLLIYQIKALKEHPPSNSSVIYTVMYSKEDSATAELLGKLRGIDIPNLKWNFIALPKERLLRRSIGRNLAAKNTVADWIWFTDCDVIFGEGALDTLAHSLEGVQTYLVYPKKMRVSPMYAREDPILNIEKNIGKILDIDIAQYREKEFDRAIGPLQITHGDVARACGYCDTLPVYQKPATHWRKAYEDKAFRWLLGTNGTGVEVPNLFYIRHSDKGRYRKGSFSSRIRKKIRQLRLRLIER